MFVESEQQKPSNQHAAESQWPALWLRVSRGTGLLPLLGPHSLEGQSITKKTFVYHLDLKCVQLNIFFLKNFELVGIQRYPILPYRFFCMQDIAILTNDATRCPQYKAESANVKPRFGCVMSTDFLKENINRILLPNTKEECEVRNSSSVTITLETQAV